MQPNRFEQLSLEIEKRVRAHPLQPLPAIPALARECNAAPQTIWKAVQLLARKGLVVCRKGARTMPASAPPGPDAQARLAAALRASIADGTWSSGEPVPKYAYLQAHYRVHQSTINAALLTLAHENMVHKRGRQWIVGAPPTSRPRGLQNPAQAGSGVVVLLFPEEIDAQHFFMWSYFSPFVAAFTGELAKLGIRLEIVRQKRGDIEPPAFRGGMSQIEALIGGLGKRYLGTLAHDMGRDFQEHWKFISMVVQKGKPVLQFTRTEYELSTYRERPPSAGPLRVFYTNEVSAVRLAIEFLAALGHRTVGFPSVPHQNFHWAGGRIQMAMRIAAEVAPSMNILTAPMAETFWNLDEISVVRAAEDFFESVSSKLQIDARLKLGKSGRRSVRSVLLDNTPSLRSLIDQGVTALIAANDTIARPLYWWLTTAGIDVPRRMSIISFDNLLDLTSMPINTVDFGFARLGYLAAHTFINDIPVKADSDGNVAGICTVVDRGSVGPEAGHLRII